MMGTGCASASMRCRHERPSGPCQRIHRRSSSPVPRRVGVSANCAVIVFFRARAEEQGGPLVKRLTRRPGEREARWMHCLSGIPADSFVATQVEAQASADVSVAEIAALKAHVSRLEDEVARLRDRFDKLTRELGVSS